MIGKHLKELREKNCLTQVEAAEKLGVTRQALSKWENDKTCPDIDKLKQISWLYSVTVEDIVYAGNSLDTGTDLKIETTDKVQ